MVADEQALMQWKSVPVKSSGVQNVNSTHTH